MSSCVKLLHQATTPIEVGDAEHFLGKDVFELALAQLNEPEQERVMHLLQLDKSPQLKRDRAIASR